MSASLLPRILLCVLLLPAFAQADADDDDDAPARAAGAPLALSAAQQTAVGLTLAHPVNGVGPRQIDAYGLVLDPLDLVADVGRLVTTKSAARNAAAEARRIEGLYHNDANASLKALQAAAAAELESQTQAQSAAAKVALDWGPIAALPDRERERLIAALASGAALLVRADVPGQHALGAMPIKALMSVDGMRVAARVLGPLPRTTPELQSAGWLLEVEHAPSGLGPGARFPITLQGAAVSGVLIPTAALLYGDAGAYVYRQLATKSADGKAQYAPVTVQLLAPEGEGWLVTGLDDDDSIVVHGAGVLWSLQGLGSFSADEDDHD
ncbi:MAG TPA: hypothetical protein VII70_04710 [Steroidobacteraceae bacterium]